MRKILPILAVASLLASTSAHAQNASVGFGSNFLVNPWMEIDQAQEGASATVTASAAGTYTYRGGVGGLGDGWAATAATSASGLTMQFQNSALMPNGSVSDVLFTVGTGSATHADGTIVDIENRVEPIRLAPLQYGTANAQNSYLQFCAKASIAGNYSFAILGGASATVAALHTVGSSYFQTFNIPSAAQATCYSFLIPGDTGGTWNFTSATNTVDTTHGATLLFVLGANGITTDKYTGTACVSGVWQNGGQNCVAPNTGQVAMDKTSGSTFEVTGVKWALDNLPITHSPMAELLEAQRYQSKTFLVGTGGQAGVKPAQNLGVAVAKGYASGGYMQVINVATGIYWPFPAVMRAAPTITTFSPVAATSACADITSGAAGGAATIESGITSNATSTTGVSISCAAATEALGDRVGVGITADARF